MTTCQSDPGLNEPAAPIDRTFMSSIVQMTGVPLSICHRMSDLLSPLKSAAPITCQLDPGLNPTAPTDVALVPSISHIAAVPSSPCQMISALPSPLKSPVPLICQLGPGLNEPAAPIDRTCMSSIVQMTGAPLPQDVGFAVA